jgi:hypothetical protein
VTAVKTFLKTRAVPILLVAGAVLYYVKNKKVPDIDEAIKDVMLLLVRFGALVETATAVTGKLTGATPATVTQGPPPIPEAAKTQKTE